MLDMDANATICSIFTSAIIEGGSTSWTREPRESAYNQNTDFEKVKTLFDGACW